VKASFSNALSRRAPALGAIGVALGLVSGLGGCVSLLPKSKPVQLYQFGRDDAATATTPATVVGRGPAGVSGVVLSAVVLPRAGMGDGILTITGDQGAYIAGARWLSPAVLMFQEDVQRTFEARAQKTRILDRGQLGAADALLRLDVSHFEVRYDGDAAAAPAVLVGVRATLTSVDGRQVLQRVFTHREPTADNRVSLLVGAFDKAVDETLAEVVDWTDVAAPTLAVAPNVTQTRSVSTQTTQTTQATQSRTPQ